MEENINKLLEKFVGYLENTESFISEQAPDFIQQMVAYYSWEVNFKFYWLIVMLIFFIILLVLSKQLFDYGNTNGNETASSVGVFILGMSAAIIVVLICILPGEYTKVKKLELAPKIFLLEKARKLIK